MTEVRQQTLTESIETLRRVARDTRASRQSRWLETALEIESLIARREAELAELHGQ